MKKLEPLTFDQIARIMRMSDSLFAFIEMMQKGAKEYPEAFTLGEMLVSGYEEAVGKPLTESQRYDFRRGLEIGYYLGRWANKRTSMEEER